jgi:hypothetical protein
MPAVVTPYTLTGLSFYLVDLVLRASKMRLRTATITAIDEQMTLIAVQGIDNGWRAGQHVWQVSHYLGSIKSNPTRTFLGYAYCRATVHGSHMLSLSQMHQHHTHLSRSKPKDFRHAVCYYTRVSLATSHAPLTWMLVYTLVLRPT